MSHLSLTVAAIFEASNSGITLVIGMSLILITPRFPLNSHDKGNGV